MADSAPAGIGLGGLLAISIVLALVGSLAWLLRRGVLKLPGRRRDQRVAVETAVSLGDRRSLVIVSVEGRRLLLGVTQAQVSLVTELQGQSAQFDARLDGHLAAPRERSAA
ncbi:MAG TPA: flagellar biosynthetic protein FliO [Vicinamibacterales bacterium]|jgi:flagellar biosynthetic protein FliO